MQTEVEVGIRPLQWRRLAAAVHGAEKESDTTERLSTHTAEKQDKDPLH